MQVHRKYAIIARKRDAEAREIFMPTYEYKCSNCNHEFEEIQKVDDPTLSSCPECQKTTLERVIAARPIIFKSKGFYKTDYGKRK